MGARDVAIAFFFEYFLGTAVPHDVKDFQVFRHRRDDVAVAAGDGSEHDFRVALLHHAAILRQQFVGPNAFVNESRHDLDAVDTTGCINLLDVEFGSGLGRHTKHRCRAGQESGDTDFQFSRLGVGNGGAHSNSSESASEQAS